MANDWAGQIEPGDIWVTVGFANKDGKTRACWIYMTRNMPNAFIEERLNVLRQQARILGVIQFFRDGTPARIVPYRGEDSAIQTDEGEQNAITIMQRVKEKVVEDLIRILNSQSIELSVGSGKTTFDQESSAAVLKSLNWTERN